VTGNDQKTKPDRRKEHLREGTEVDHARTREPPMPASAARGRPSYRNSLS
jgi:hypothetical protein